MPKKMLILIAALFIFLAISPAKAIDNTSQIPELNPFCWHRKDCEKINKDGFVSDKTTGVCTGGTGDSQWGRCLPAGTTKTEISFGGKSEFSNIGDFIIVMYKYMLAIASIVAVVVIIIAGAQWTTSGGNSEAIGAAKKRIGGAVIGLFIAYMSYFVLNTINPALVNLRLPQVWLIKPAALVPEFCEDLPGATEGTLKFAFVAPADQPNKPIPAAKDRSYIPWPVQPCGDRYLAENGGETTCRGNSCASSGEGLACIDTKGDGAGYECKDAVIYGNISNSDYEACGFVVGALGNLANQVKKGIASPWGCPPVSSIGFITICKDGNELPQLGAGNGTNINHYWIEQPKSSMPSLAQECDDHGGLAGFEAVPHMEVQFTVGSLLNPIGLVAGEYENQTHYVGKGGVDLSVVGKNVFLADPAKYLFSLDEVLKGARLDFDAADIKPY